MHGLRSSVGAAKFCPNCGTPHASSGCKACGTAIQPGSKFCPNCGAHLKALRKSKRRSPIPWRESSKLRRFSRRGESFHQDGVLSLLNATPEKLFIDYDTASTFWPGRCTSPILRSAGATPTSNGASPRRRRRGDRPPRSPKKRFHAERVRGDGISFRLRQRLEKAEATPARVATISRPSRASPIRR